MFKKILGCFAFSLGFIIFTFVFFPNQTFAAQSGDFTYIISGSNAEITAYTGVGGDVSIPSTLDGYNLTAIGNFAFSGKSLTSVTIPSSVTSIGNATFAGVPTLISLTLNNGLLSIGANAFASTGLTSITIPDSVTSIGTGAFSGAPLQSVTIGKGIKNIDGYIFTGMSSLKSVTLSNELLSIGDTAFAGTGITSIAIPDSVTSIGLNAFSSTGLTSITIPGSVTSIGDSAFNISSLLKTYFLNNAPSSMGNSIFGPTTIYYISGKTGFDGAWNTYNTIALNIPTVTNNDATFVTATEATLNGIITNNGGDDVTIKFEYGKTEDYGTEVELDVKFTTGESFTNSLSGLTCGTTYNYNIIGTNFAGIGNGENKTFITSACPLAVTPVATSHTSSGSSASSRYTNLISMGNTQAAEDLKREFPNQINSVITPVVITTSVTIKSYNFGTVTLKRGSKGEAVKELQRFLNVKLNLGLIIDGKLGPKTILVIKQWQKDNGLVADGLIGNKTKEKMNSID